MRLVHPLVLSILLAAPLLAADSKPLPLIEVPARTASAGPLFAVIISGDGGWAKIDKSISAGLAGQGIPVVGLNALEYFWTARAPETLARDVATIIERYGARWNATHVLLIGYSRGADVLPFAVTRLPEPIRKRVALVALLSPSKSATFEFKVADWFKDRNGVPTRPEIDKMRGTKTICVYGTDDPDTVCTDVDARVARPIALAGSHHFDRDYDQLTKIITGQVTTP
ncbi:MAG TPA: AcvB/VirJ family lysyl-phosphatidylglycerol hydrolase [Thermoanaerobaculia bacterium]|nr:AcvB/VirJ family lysyl-phosphatidylglycerol hydrolase [Thermoanaerobaculia bacterium]